MGICQNTGDNLKLKQKIEKFGEKLEERVRESNGFMTKTGSLLSTKEWHASAIGISWATLSYIMPTPLDAAFVITYLLFIRQVVKGKAFTGSQLGDARSEMAYNLGFYAFTALLLEVYSSYSVESMEIGTALIRVLVGA